MSIKLMSRIWDASFPPTEKLILLAMADFADDSGLCWPSVATIAKKTGVSERTVQRTLRWAEHEAKILVREEIKGVGCRYYLKGRHGVTPDNLSPATNETPTPDTVTPKPLRTINGSEAKASSPSAKSDFPRPEGVDPQVWRDFLANRKAKKATNTATAYKRLMDDLKRWESAEWTIPKLIEHAAAMGWAGIYNPNGRDGGNGKAAYPVGHSGIPL